MRLSLVALLLSFVALLTACNDTTGFQVDPSLAVDTVLVAAPTSANDTLPTLLDITQQRTGRFPERVEDAGQWDFAIRVRDGSLVFVPAGALGVVDPTGRVSRAAITRPLTDVTFEGLERAPSNDRFVSDSAVVIREGAVYAARSRVVSCGFGSGFQYAKLQPLEVDAVKDRVQLRIVTSQRCGDPRLVLED